MVGLKTLVVFGIYTIVKCATSDNVGDKSGIKNVGTRPALPAPLKTVADGVHLSADQLIGLPGKLPVERDAAPSVHPRKGVKSSISARKGVEPISSPQEFEFPANSTPAKNSNLAKIEPLQLTPKPEALNNDTSTTEKNEKVSEIHQREQLKKKSNEKIEKNDTPLEFDLLPSVTNETTEKIPKISDKSKLKKIKPKPTVTIAGAGDDKPSFGVPTKTPPLGMSSKINYVVPVIVTLLVLPLFVVFVIFLYRNGRECWEKRHYRRMDFLIDGMYNE